jgi:DNA-binding response OmpR family regulator
VSDKDRILIIEDNPDTRRYLEMVLSKDFEVLAAENAVLGLELAKNSKPTLIVLDIVLPIMNGYDACQLLKQDETTKAIPIIFLSSKNTVNDITHGLDLGADDYLPKPFDYKELVARIKARLRDRDQQRKEPKTVAQGKLKLVLDSREAFYNNAPVELTNTEFEILRVLMERTGAVVPRDDIMRHVWSDGDEAQKRTIDVHIRAIRRKVPDLTKHVISVYGVGYKYEG